MFFELRTYPLKPGKRDEFVQYMDEVIIPYQVSKGMIVTGSFYDEENDQYVWMRRFESEEERQQLYDAVYKTDIWQTDFSPKIGEMIDREGIVVKRIKPSARSLMR